MTDISLLHILQLQQMLQVLNKQLRFLLRLRLFHSQIVVVVALDLPLVPAWDVRDVSLEVLLVLREELPKLVLLLLAPVASAALDTHSKW